MKFYIPILIFLSSINIALAQDPSEPCLNKLKSEAKLQELFKRLPFDISKGQSLEVLSNNNKISEDDKTALSYFVLEGQNCLNLGADWRSANYPPEMINAISLYMVETLSTYSDLYGGNITYGEVAKRRAKLIAELDIKVREIVNASVQKKKEAESKKKSADNARLAKERREREQANAEAIARQQMEQQQIQARRNAIIQNWRPMDPITITPYQMKIPSQTNCQMIGNQMNCQTY